MTQEIVINANNIDLRSYRNLRARWTYEAEQDLAAMQLTISQNMFDAIMHEVMLNELLPETKANWQKEGF
jgi:hypothetical protein